MELGSEFLLCWIDDCQLLWTVSLWAYTKSSLSFSLFGSSHRLWDLYFVWIVFLQWTLSRFLSLLDSWICFDGMFDRAFHGRRLSITEKFLNPSKSYLCIYNIYNSWSIEGGTRIFPSAMTAKWSLIKAWVSILKESGRSVRNKSRHDDLFWPW